MPCIQHTKSNCKTLRDESHEAFYNLMMMFEVFRRRQRLAESIA